jgi:hypothetical protein
VISSIGKKCSMQMTGNEFEKSMEKEVNVLQDNVTTFDIKERSSVPNHMKGVQAICSFPQN